ncbi:MAG: UDP-glucose/GDP-mannose dehydrogenase family protein, partial [Mucispirillum sp.]|nr:UDP-glucose/GDP-mannose dehydrogenase family protein [Mucispirillum sp.]
MNIVVTGTGYVGLVTAVCLAEMSDVNTDFGGANTHITCLDIDQMKIDALNTNGFSHIFERDLDALMVKNKDKITYSTDFKNAYKLADVIFICVSTPEKRDGSANLTYVYEAVKSIAEFAEKDCVVVVKSTVPIGTNDKVEKILKENSKNNVSFYVVSNPEFLSQGTAVQDTIKASRIVIGSENEKAINIMLEIYKNFDVPKIITNRKSAEMIKYASNNFLALKISFINEIANLCEKIGANIEDVVNGMGYDERIGNKFLNAGIGYGGSCFPKDTKALHWLSSWNDYELKTIKAAIEINENQKLRLIKKSQKYYNNLGNLNIAVLGLTFKPETDDLREAPSKVNIDLMLDDGAAIRAYDPVGIPNFSKLYPESVNNIK